MQSQPPSRSKNGKLRERPLVGHNFLVRLSLEDKAKMDEIKRRDGVPLAVQIRFALTAWLATK